MKVDDCRKCQNHRWLGPNSQLVPVCFHTKVLDKCGMGARLEWNDLNIPPAPWCPLDVMPEPTTSLVSEILEVARSIGAERDPSSIILKVMEEVGELATEVAIASGKSYKHPGKDGVLGEAVDALIAIVDLIYKSNPDITEAEIVEVARKKLDKWKRRAGPDVMTGDGLQSLANSIRELVGDRHRVYVFYGNHDTYDEEYTAYAVGTEDPAIIAEKVAKSIKHRDDKMTTIIALVLNGARSYIKLAYRGR